MSKKRKYEIKKQRILPGFEAGNFEPRRNYDRLEFSHALEEHLRRDSRINVRVSGHDLAALQHLALTEGVPTQSLVAQIVHDYVKRELPSQNRETQDHADQTPRPSEYARRQGSTGHKAD